MNYITFRHYANIGDIISVMASIKSYYDQTGVKAIFYQQLNVKAEYYAGASHPTKDNSGTQVCCNQKMYDMIRPLLLAQPYIHDVQEYTGQKAIINLDVFRSEGFANLPYGMIQSWPMLVYPDLAADLTQPWISVEGKYDGYKDLILVNFTERYRNNTLNYFFLKEHSDKLRFVGTDEEWIAFREQWDLPHLSRAQVADFLDLAIMIKSCKFVLGNQSFVWNLAEAMKHPRLLEMCSFAPNCQPFIGKHSYGYYHQNAVEYYFDKLMNEG
jgi:hypothetical protein